jgi:peptidoglycan/LPS O-acetylase OafA/YrhL
MPVTNKANAIERLSPVSDDIVIPAPGTSPNSAASLPESSKLGSGSQSRSWVKSLDALRGAAALYVLLSHISLLTFIPHALLQRGDSLLTRLTALFFEAFTFGHQAVIIFFVLSGFCIHYRQAKGTYESRRDSKFDVLGYYERRAHRILPPYYFAIAYTALCVFLFEWINPAFAQHLTGYRYADQILTVHNSWHTLVGNLVFQQWLTCQTYGNNTPLWSLSFEIYFYLLYPLFIGMWRRIGPARAVSVVALISLCSGLAFRVYSGDAASGAWTLAIGEYWIDWCLGCIAVEIYLHKNNSAFMAACKPWATALLIGAWLASVKLVHLPLAFSDFLGALASVGLVLTLLRPVDLQPGNILSKAGIWTEHQLSVVGKFSYSLYLTHVPTLALICTLWFLHHSTFPTNPLVPLASIVVCLIVAKTTYELVEKRSLNH